MVPFLSSSAPPPLVTNRFTHIFITQVARILGPFPLSVPCGLFVERKTWDVFLEHLDVGSGWGGFGPCSFSGVDLESFFHRSSTLTRPLTSTPPTDFNFRLMYFGNSRGCMSATEYNILVVWWCVFLELSLFLPTPPPPPVLHRAVLPSRPRLVWSLPLLPTLFHRRPHVIFEIGISPVSLMKGVACAYGDVFLKLSLGPTPLLSPSFLV